MTDLLNLYPALANVTLDGTNDFNEVASVIGTRNPKLVWAVVNELRKPKADPKLDQLKALLNLK